MQADPDNYAPDAAWMQTLGGMSEGRQTTLRCLSPQMAVTGEKNVQFSLGSTSCITGRKRHWNSFISRQCKSSADIIYLSETIIAASAGNETG